MRKANYVLRISIILFLFAAVMSSCLKEPEDQYASYTPEREANLIISWRAQMKKNKVELDSFMVNNSKVYFTLDTTKVGTGPTVKTGDKVTVKYTGMFLNGSIFDTANSYSYTHKDTDPENRMIVGWEESIEHLNKGAKGVFMVPSALAYGSARIQGSIIPPNTPLIFVIDVLNIQ
ncbi:MAG: FKBP-type peptidyl-prolyl cis-trans isomerase [Methylococcaceae bacterium]|nr:FKBP-type peptidyl-prolyl cis-trans isomerase [Prolixibacteraceae bacterium]